ncbi:hypothetical protein [Qipengyuania sp. ASV99]|uniref:hypothetical protein n=1 Tax=Qipengyuania sp. ASV99 TaxID=3399681 RepID=UPI003A4C6671
MKKILTASVISMAMATSAMAQSNAQSQDVVVTASVPQECSIEDIADLAFASLTINEAPGIDALQLSEFEAAGSQQAWVSCNFNNQLTISTPLPLTSATAAGLTVSPGSEPFTSTINYGFRAQNYGGGEVVANSLDRLTATRSTGPIHRQVRFSAFVRDDQNAGARPIAADDYTATATVEITTI